MKSFRAIQVTFLPHLIKHMVHKGIVDALVITSNSSSGYDSWKADTGRFVFLSFYNYLE